MINGLFRIDTYSLLKIDVKFMYIFFPQWGLIAGWEERVVLNIQNTHNFCNSHFLRLYLLDIVFDLMGEKCVCLFIYLF